MDHRKAAEQYHAMGYNCSQSVLAAFSDMTGLGERESLSAAGCFGRGAGAGELCGAVCGALLALGAMTPVDPQDPAGSKLRSVALGRMFLERFSQVFGDVRCRDLLPKPLTAEDATPAVREMGITDHCSILAASAAEIVEDLLREREMDQANHA